MDRQTEVAYLVLESELVIATPPPARAKLGAERVPSHSGYLSISSLRDQLIMNVWRNNPQTGAKSANFRDMI